MDKITIQSKDSKSNNKKQCMICGSIININDNYIRTEIHNFQLHPLCLNPWRPDICFSCNNHSKEEIGKHIRNIINEYKISEENYFKPNEKTKIIDKYITINKFSIDDIHWGFEQFYLYRQEYMVPLQNTIKEIFSETFKELCAEYGSENISRESSPFIRGVIKDKYTYYFPATNGTGALAELNIYIERI